MATERIIGILGGMGPEATLNLFEKILKNTPATKDQEHFRIIIDNNPKIPDRNEAIVGGGEDPLPVLVDSGRTLEDAGVDFIVVPCISAHFFLNALSRELAIPVLSILDEVAVEIKKDHPEIKTVGLLAATATLKAGLFQRRIEQENIVVLVPEEQDQEQVMAAIYQIKASTSEGRRDAEAILKREANRLIERGADGIIAGCTEIPLALFPEDIAVPLFDSLLVLARAAVRTASGR